MATTATATKTATKRSAPAPKVNNGTAPTKAPQGKPAAKAAAPQAVRYQLGPWPAQQRGHRAYARAVADQLTKKTGDKGFTLAEYRAALVAGAAASELAPPAGGWEGHNMPTWTAHPKQGWLTPVTK